MGKNELSEAGTSMVRDNMANFRRDTRKTRVTGYPGGKAWWAGKEIIYMGGIIILLIPVPITDIFCA